MSIARKRRADGQAILDPNDYKVAWIAPLEIEAKAALCLLVKQYRGRFPVNRGDNYVFHAGAMGGHNIIIATLPAESGAAGIVNQILVGVIRGVCDYGDQYENKDWKPYAAAMAASYARALFDEIPPSETSRALTDSNEKAHEPCYYMPFTRDTRFTGCTAIFSALEDKVFDPDHSQEEALVGLNELGENHIAVDVTNEIKEKVPENTILCVPVLRGGTKGRLYVDVATKLELQKRREDDNVKDCLGHCF
ncbi:kinesin light chain [Fusarium longipes]|uniref:Kinesin light chain n=1 Tax=Fusarium longipes TaxID=694270 RepID=A0A395T9T0_9HYPO|nr:kinesin light chain [Fusarium longipes]